MSSISVQVKAWGDRSMILRLRLSVLLWIGPLLLRLSAMAFHLFSWTLCPLVLWNRPALALLLPGLLWIVIGVVYLSLLDYFPLTRKGDNWVLPSRHRHFSTRTQEPQESSDESEWLLTNKFYTYISNRCESRPGLRVFRVKICGLEKSYFWEVNADSRATFMASWAASKYLCDLFDAQQYWNALRTLSTLDCMQHDWRSRSHSADPPWLPQSTFDMPLGIYPAYARCFLRSSDILRADVVEFGHDGTF